MTNRQSLRQTVTARQSVRRRQLSRAALHHVCLTSFVLQMKIRLYPIRWVCALLLILGTFFEMPSWCLNQTINEGNPECHQTTDIYPSFDLPMLKPSEVSKFCVVPLCPLCWGSLHCTAVILLPSCCVTCICYLHQHRYAAHCTVLSALHCTQHTTLYSVHYTVLSALHCTQCTTLYSAHYTVLSALHCTQCTTHRILYTHDT